MHEHSFTEEIVAAVLSELSGHADERPRRVHITVGESLHLNASSVRSHFEALTAGTTLEGALLELDEVPMTVRCRACEAKGPVEDHHCPRCLECGSGDVVVVSGENVTIDAIELETK